MKEDLDVTIRRAMEGRSLYDIAKATEIDASQLSRFYRGERTITLATASRLCKELGLTLVPPGIKKRKGTS